MSQKTTKQVLSTLGTVLRIQVSNSNHIRVYLEGGILLTSYGRPAAIITYSGNQYVCEYTNEYHVTNSREVNAFLNVDAKGRAQGIKSGAIEVIGD